MTLRNLIVLFLLSVSTACFGIEEGTITVDNLNVRGVPNGDVVDKLDKGHSVRVAKQEDGWSQVSYDRPETGTKGFGWVSSDYIALGFAAKDTQCEQDLCVATLEPELDCNTQIGSLGYSNCIINVGYELSNKTNTEKQLGVSCTVDVTTKRLSDSEGEAETSREPPKPPGIHSGGKLDVRIGANLDVSGYANKGEFYVRSRLGAVMTKPDGSQARKLSTDDREILTSFEGTDLSTKDLYLMWSDKSVFERFPELSQGDSYRELNITAVEYDWDTRTWYVHDNSNRIAFEPLYTDVVIARFEETPNGIGQGIAYADFIDFSVPNNSVEVTGWLTSSYSGNESHLVANTKRDSLSIEIKFSEQRPVSYAKIDSTACQLLY